MEITNITEYYNALATNASIITAVDDALTAVFFGSPWHWTIGAIVTMILIYVKTEDLLVTSLPGMVILVAFITFGKLTAEAYLPLAFIGVLAFTAFFYGIFKKDER